jgi:hypothetical protein
MPKKAKGAAGCMYAGLTGAQLAELLRAVCAPVSGSNKEALVQRLREHPLAARYAVEGRSPTLSRATLDLVGGRDGLQLADIKEECKQKGLRVSGTRFELVLSLLRVAGGAEAPPPPKPRAAPTKPADAAALEARVLAKCNAVSDTWSNQRHKDHAGTVYDAAAKILHKEAHDKGLLAARNPAVVDAAAAVLRGLLAGFRALPSPSYGGGYDLGCMGNTVREIGVAMAPSMTPARRAELRGLCDALAQEASRYALDCLNGMAQSFAEP